MSHADTSTRTIKNSSSDALAPSEFHASVLKWHQKRKQGHWWSLRQCTSLLRNSLIHRPQHDIQLRPWSPQKKKPPFPRSPPQTWFFTNFRMFTMTSNTCESLNLGHLCSLKFGSNWTVPLDGPLESPCWRLVTQSKSRKRRKTGLVPQGHWQILEFQTKLCQWNLRKWRKETLEIAKSTGTKGYERHKNVN